MTEEELEEQIQFYKVEHALLYNVNPGRHAADRTSFEAVVGEHERNICSTFLFQLPMTWRKTKGRGVRVAILDTGVDTNHPSLVDSIVDTADFTGQGIEDLHGHGTHCAGIIGARPDGTGPIGLAPECELLVGKVLNNDGVGSFSDIAEGVDWAVDAGAHIISMFMCGPSSSPLLYRSITYALAKGVHIICAAGGTRESPGANLSYPGRYGDVITVASYDKPGTSSYDREPDFTAPGENVWSAYKQGSYKELSGCSTATSFVAGVAALIVSKHLSARCSITPIFNCEDLRGHLTAIADLPREYGGDRKHPQLPPFLSLGSLKRAVGVEA